MERGRGLQMLKQEIAGQKELERIRDATRLRDASGRFVPKQAQIEGVNRSLNSLRERMQSLSPATQRFLLQMRQYAGNAKLLDAAIEGNTRRLRQLGIQAGMTGAEIAAFEKAVRAIPIENMDRLAHAVSGLGRTMQLFGAVGTAAFGLAANAAAEFNTNISLAATQARDIGAGAGQVQQRISQLTQGYTDHGQKIKGVLDLMQEYPADAKAMSDATYDIFSSMDLENQGIIDVTKGLGLLEKANKVAVAGGVELEEATSAMITTFNNFGFSAEAQTENLDTMFDIVRFGRMRLSDFNIMMNKIAPAAADAGMKLEDVGGAMAYLTTVMPSQRMVATGISRLIEALRHPDIVEGLRMFGVEAKTATGQLRPLDELLLDISKAFPQLRTGQKSAAEFFREISAAGRGGGRGQIFTQEGRRAFSEIMTHVDEWLDAQRRIEQNTNEFARAYAAQLQSLGVQWDIFKNRLRAIVISIGTDAIPVFAELGRMLKDLLDWWQSIDPETRAFIVRMGALAAVGTLVSGILLAVIGGFMAFEAAMRRVLVSGAGMTGFLGSIRILLSRIATLAAVSILIKAKWGGDPTARDFIMAAITGAAAGYGIAGPWGAAAGAIVMPVLVLALSGDSVQDVVNQMAEDLLKRTKNMQPAMRAYGKYIATNWKAGITEGLMSEDEFKDFFKTTKMLDARERAQSEGIHDTVAAKKQATAATKKYKDALHEYYLQLQQNREENSRYIESLKEYNRQLDLATKQAGVTAVQNLKNMYMSMEQVNRQAFGELFQGPWLTSPTFDLAKEWGIKPRMDDLIKDLTMQNSRFNKWRKDLDRLMKKGLPKDFIDEIRQLGPEAGQGIIEQILNAKPEQVSRLIRQWKQREKQIKSQTKMDFTDEIERFKQAGVDMGDAIVNGFQSAKVGKWFDSWVKVAFPQVISNAVAQAVKEWKETNPPPTPPKKPVRPTPPQVPMTVGAAASATMGAGGGSHVDNSSTVTVTVKVDDTKGSTGAGRGDPYGRRLAWVIANAIRTHS
jgi:TP901 family phage tail tape measure protein